MTSATTEINVLAEPRRAVGARLDALVSKTPLDQEVAAAAVHSMRDPDVVRDRLGAALRYSQRVEADVAGLAIDILLPHDADDHLGRFLTAWVPDELGHAASQEVLLEALGLPVYEARDADYVPFHNRIAGTLARISDRAYDIVSMTYHTIGSLNERLAMGAYRRMAEIAVEIDEPGLAEHLLRPTAKDEAFHLGYYRTYAQQLRARMAPWQIAAVRALICRTYIPVGAGGKDDRAPFGEVVLSLEDDPDNPTIADTVHDIAQDLLARDRGELPRFAHRALARCVEQARLARTA